MVPGLDCSLIGCSKTTLITLSSILTLRTYGQSLTNWFRKPPAQVPGERHHCRRVGLGPDTHRWAYVALEALGLPVPKPSEGLR